MRVLLAAPATEPGPSVAASSAPSSTTFVALVAVLAVLFVLVHRRSGGGAMMKATIFIVALLAITGGLAYSGVLESTGPPPAALLYFVGCNGLAIVLAVSSVGRRILANVSVAALIGFQAFRIPSN